MSSQTSQHNPLDDVIQFLGDIEITYKKCEVMFYANQLASSPQASITSLHIHEAIRFTE